MATTGATMAAKASGYSKTFHRITLGVGLGLPILLFIVGYWFIEFQHSITTL